MNGSNNVKCFIQNCWILPSDEASFVVFLVPIISEVCIRKVVESGLGLLPAGLSNLLFAETKTAV